MRRLFTPVIWLVSRLSYPRKLLLAALALLLPTLVLAGLSFIEQQQALERTRLERHGLALLMPLLKVSLATWNDPALADSPMVQPGGGDAVAAEIDALQARFTTVRGGDVVVRRFDALRAQRESLRAERAAGEARVDRLQALNREWRLALAEAADSAGLAADGDPLVAALVDSLSVKLPLLVENYAVARDLGAAAIENKRLRAKQRNLLNVVRGSLDPLIMWNIENIDRAAAVVPSLQGRLEAPLSVFNSAPLGLQEALTTKVIDTTDFDIAVDEYRAKGDQAIAATLALATGLVPEIDAQLAAREETFRFRRNAVVILLAAFALGLSYGFIGAYLSILQGIQDIGTAARALADGDLRRRVQPSSTDEIGVLAAHFNVMADSFEALTRNTLGATGQMAQSVEQVHQSSREIESAAERQNASIARTASAVESLSVSVRAVAQHALDTDRIAAEAQHEAGRGERCAADVSQEMARISSSVNETVMVMQRLVAHSTEIGCVVLSIREIAEQTNLLALNAAIEAARAGESGRGFAVVADEVRKLSERTRHSTQEISGTIENIQADIASAVACLGDSSAQVNGSVAVVDELGRVLADIRRHVGISAGRIRDIVEATTAQSGDSEQITRNIQEIAVMSERSHDSARAAAESMGRLNALAGEMTQSVSHLQIRV